MTIAIAVSASTDYNNASGFDTASGHSSMPCSPGEYASWQGLNIIPVLPVAVWRNSRDGGIILIFFFFNFYFVTLHNSSQKQSDTSYSTQGN